MKTLELKNILIHQIAGINDKSFLAAIKTIVDTKTASMIYKTNSNQKANILNGIDQIEKGEFINNEDLEIEIDKWLDEK